jgi:hypothetical protein
VGQTVHTDKTTRSAQAHVLQVWQTLSLPDGLRLDNDTAFCGGYKKPRTLGQFIRLSLYFGVELIFIPVGEPACNGEVESVLALWGARDLATAAVWSGLASRPHHAGVSRLGASGAYPRQLAGTNARPGASHGLPALFVSRADTASATALANQRWASPFHPQDCT